MHACLSLLPYLGFLQVLIDNEGELRGNLGEEITGLHSVKQQQMWG